MPHALASPEVAKEVLHVFDLPQVYAKPSAQELLDGLALLSIQTPSWDRDGNGLKSKAKSGKPLVAPEGVTKYLTSIIASDLRWVKGDEQKEAIWEEASLRLSERSGRTGMPAMTRSFTIPKRDGHFELSIHEPSLTGDSLGFKTWAASYLLSKRLHTIDLPERCKENNRILELGSGTGLVGMAAAIVLGATVLLTDLPEIEGNLTRNVTQNERVITENGGIAKTAILDWTNPTKIVSSPSSVSTPGLDIIFAETDTPKFPIIVAADSVYSADHPSMLVGAIENWLATGPNARVIIELPRREGYSNELGDLKQRMLKLGLTILEEGEETGYDDWGGSGENELQDVNCWWSIWGWEKVE